jgi:hypothetical protein
MLLAYTGLLLHAMRCTAVAAAQQGGEMAEHPGMAELVGFVRALLSLLHDAAELVRRGGHAAEAAHTYMLLLRRLASQEPRPLHAAFAAAVGACSPNTKRLLLIFLAGGREQAPDGASDGTGGTQDAVAYSGRECVAQDEEHDEDLAGSGDELYDEESDTILPVEDDAHGGRMDEGM